MFSSSPQAGDGHTFEKTLKFSGHSWLKRHTNLKRRCFKNDAFTSQQTQNICIKFEQCWSNVEDVGPPLYKRYKNVLYMYLLGLPWWSQLRTKWQSGHSWLKRHTCIRYPCSNLSNSTPTYLKTGFLSRGKIDQKNIASDLSAGSI